MYDLLRFKKGDVFVKIAKKLVAVAVSALMMFSIAGMNVFAASTTQDGLEVSLTTDKEAYSKDEKITATLSVKNTNKAAVNDVSLENIIPNGYEISSGSSANKSVQTLEAGASEVLVTNLTAVKNNQESSEESSKAEESSKDVVVNPGLDVPPTGDNDKALYIAILVLVAAFAVTVVCVKNKKGKQLLSLFLCVAVMGAVLPLSGSLVSAKTISNKVSVSEKIKIDGNALLLDSIVSYSLITAETENLTINLDGTLYDDGSKTYYQPEEMPTLTGTLENVFNVKKANCTVKDVNGKVLINKDFEPEKQWTVDDFALIIGENTVTVSVEYTDGTKDEKTVKINNINEKNMDSLNVDKNDDDKDGVLNFIEEMYHTDPKNEDSDKDGLTDYYEMAVLGTDPNKLDSVGNGISDADEDADKDGLTNIDEIKNYNTDPTCIDSDGDTISDSDEINKYKTNPNEADTDKDGKDDNWEIENEYDPIVPNTDFPEEKEETGKTPDGVDISSPEFVKITELDDDFFIDPSTPGYIGVKPISVEVADGKSTEITIKYEQSNLDDGEQPTLYRFNKDTQRYEEVPSEITSEGEVKATIDKSGTYVLLNHRYVNDVWSNDIISDTDDGLTQGDLDIAFVIDCSSSMDQNDPNSIRQAVVKEFISKLRVNDSAAIVKYTEEAETLVPLTKDKDLLITSIDSVRTENGGCGAGTNGSAGLRNALTELEKSKAPHKYIIFLTDGHDTSQSEPYFEKEDTEGLVPEIAGKNIIIHTIGLVGTGEVDIDLLNKIAKKSNGNYYLATAGEEAEIAPDVLKLEDVYDEIEEITIGKLQDSNEDGISDYYTKLMCEGKILTSKGNKIFGDATYKEVQEVIGDFDGDGLINGTKIDPNTGAIVEKGEIELTYDELGVYAKIYSYPNNPDSDNDGLNDHVETKSGTDPLKKNAFVYKSEVDGFTNSENFYSNIYLNMYNNSGFEQGSVFIGNAFFGTTFDQTSLYQQAIVDVFEEISTVEEQVLTLQNNKDTVDEFTTQLFSAYSDAFVQAIDNNDSQEVEELKGSLLDIVEDAKSIIDTAEDPTDVIQNIINPAEELGKWKGKDFIDVKWAINLITKNDKVKAKYYMDLANQYFHDINSFRKPDTWTTERANAYLNNLTKKWLDAGAKRKELKTDIKIKNAKFDKFFKGLSIAFYLKSIGDKAVDSYLEYNRLMANIETMQKNVEMLDTIIASPQGNPYLLNAAKNIKYYLSTMYNNDVSTINKWAIYNDYTMPVLETTVAETIHLLIGEIVICGVPVGAIIELTRTLGNAVFDIDEMSENASKTVALASLSDILSKNYLAHLNGGYAVMSDDKNYWIAYKDYSNKIHTTLINIAEARKCAENQMCVWQDDEDIQKGCEYNTKQCNELVKKYLARLLAFNCV